MRVAGIVLAAGSSARLGRPKQLLPFRGRPILAVTIANALASKLDQVVVVLGKSAAEIQTALGTAPVSVVINERYAEGQSTSLLAGLATLDPKVDAVLFLLGDQPTVAPAVIDALIDAFAEGHGPIIQPSYRGTSGNPVLFARSLFPSLEKITGDAGARSLLKSRPELITHIPVDADIPPDVDTDADYQHLLDQDR